MLSFSANLLALFCLDDSTHGWCCLCVHILFSPSSVPPSVPVCRLQGDTYVGNDVTLSCQSSHGLPRPIYSWHREQNAADLPPDSFIEGTCCKNTKNNTEKTKTPSENRAFVAPPLFSSARARPGLYFPWYFHSKKVRKILGIFERTA